MTPGFRQQYPADFHLSTELIRWTSGFLFSGLSGDAPNSGQDLLWGAAWF